MFLGSVPGLPWFDSVAPGEPGRLSVVALNPCSEATSRACRDPVNRWSRNGFHTLGPDLIQFDEAAGDPGVPKEARARLGRFGGLRRPVFEPRAPWIRACLSTGVGVKSR
jgi:hypothetical protein